MKGGPILVAMLDKERYQTKAKKDRDSQIRMTLDKRLMASLVGGHIGLGGTRLERSY